jgi:hypothetical protein
MFTPEFVLEARNQFVLVANHSLETDKSVELSLAYNKARLQHGLLNMPKTIKNAVLIYDIRGQNVSQKNKEILNLALSPLCELQFKTS